jgi:phosphate transport system substrate-binding protein
MTRLWPAAFFAAFLAFSAACQDFESVSIDGSSTVYPITAAAAEEYAKGSKTRVNIAFSGTGGGFEKFCRGDIDVANASRPIKDDETEKCAATGIRKIVELQVAIDALTVAVNPENGFVDCLTIEELFEIFREGGAGKWSDIRPEWPDRPVHTYYPGTDSGTFDYFVEAIVEEVDENAAHRGDGTSSEDDNVLTLGVSEDPDAISYFGFAYFQEAGDSLKAVPIDAGERCVDPTHETAAAGEYPLSRPLLVYTAEQYIEDDPEVAAFLDFYLRNSGALVEEVGYVPLPEDAIEEQLALLQPYLRTTSR